MKSQVLIIQFVIYSTLGFILFVLIANMFDLSFFKLKKDISTKYSSYISKIIESYAINLITNCKDCYFESIISFKNLTKQNFEIKVNQQNNNLVVRNIESNINYTSSFNRLNFSYLIRFENYTLYME
ncbi:MAG: hypothetical protein QW641_03025 [Candidatus Aenigmatarchaeota archaeon]